MAAEKVRYELDPHNRLTVKSSALRGIRKVLDGRFKIDAQNDLTYHVKAPIPAGIKAPHQFKLKGRWSLSKEHQLRLTLDKWSRETFGDQITLQGEILDLRKNALLFAVTSQNKEGLPSLYALELVGSWQADKDNRLTFRVDKGQGSYDTLVFDGIWQLNQNYEITYRCQKQKGVRKSKKIHTLIFKGGWDIRDQARLSYVIDKDTDAGFDFHTAIGIFKDNYIKYELGIGMAQKKAPLRRVIVFPGKWRLKKNLGLVFEVRTQKRKVQEIILGAEARLKGSTTVLFDLRSSLNREIGAQLELSRDIFKGEGQAFLRLLASREEAAIVAVCGWRW